ncbi:MAG: ABC transporter ATP-binding protein [candidate division NC10 bacterium]|nr:ABC transporter ATP-binding protein [candidate division NC10 bacterium]
MVIIKTWGLCKFYDPTKTKEIRALYNVNLQVGRGEFLVIRGPSGSGKTTLLSLIGALDRPTKGQIYLYGEDITNFSEAALARIRREKIGFVFQNFNLLPRLPAWENVTYPLIPVYPRARDRMKWAQELLERFQLEDRFYHSPEEMSGGEQQRVAIARALVNDPEIIIADEPTSNIDAESIENLVGILKTMKMEGRTILMATHERSIFPLADAFLDLKRGQPVGE